MYVPEDTTLRELAVRIDQALADSLGRHLSCLTALKLNDAEDIRQGWHPSLLMQHISTMVSLKHLSMAWTAPYTAGTLPGIECLTALEDLDLWCGVLESSCLLRLTTGLTRLALGALGLEPRQAQQDSTLGASQLLQLLARLRALQKMELGGVSGDWPQQLSAHSALTASSNLQELRVDDCNLQSAALEHMLPAGRKLPHLHTLVAVMAPPPSFAFSTAAVCRVVDCCPALRELEVKLQEGASMAPLTSLTAVSSLDFGGVSRDDIRSCVAALTHLQCLELDVSAAAEGPSLGLQDLLPLTVLTSLTSLQTRGNDTEHGDWRVNLHDKFRAGAAPVWVRLLEQCAADPASQPAVISSVALQLQQQQERGAQQAAQLQQQAVQLQEQQQQLAASRAEAAELRGQVQTLQTQLQEVLAAFQQQRQG